VSRFLHQPEVGSVVCGKPCQNVRTLHSRSCDRLFAHCTGRVRASTSSTGGGTGGERPSAMEQAAPATMVRRTTQPVLGSGVQSDGGTTPNGKGGTPRSVTAGNDCQ